MTVQFSASLSMGPPPKTRKTLLQRVVDLSARRHQAKLERAYPMVSLDRIKRAAKELGECAEVEVAFTAAGALAGFLGRFLFSGKTAKGVRGALAGGLLGGLLGAGVSRLKLKQTREDLFRAAAKSD